MDVATVKTKSKHRENGEFQENPDNCSGFGFYIDDMLVNFGKQMSFLNTGGIKQIIPNKIFEDGATSIFVRRQGK